MKSKKRKSFIQWFLAIFALVFLGVVATINTFIFVNAAAVTGLTDTGISLDVTGDSGQYSCSASGTSITLSATGESGTCSGTAHSATLTIKNVKGGTGTLSFAYSLTLNSGTVTIGGSSVSSNSTYSGSLANNASLTIKVTSTSDAKTTTISITNILLAVDITATATFSPDPNGGSTYGTYTVNCTDGNFSTTITDTSQTHTVSSLQTYSLSATAKSGYAFDCWHIGSSVNSNASVTGLSISTNTTIYPIFKPASAATYQVGSDVNARYFDLAQAITAASSAKKISVVGNGTVPAGTYTIPSGYTLLVPFDAALTVYTSTPDVVYGSHTNPTAYKILTLASGANLIINGSLCCSGKLCTTGQMGGWNGTPTGPDGRINMQSGSTITIKSGGNLYAWGYIYGSGSVVAESGSTVYEAFQIKDWRGGTATSNVYKYAFIFSQYYVQNIEVPLTIYSGATEKLYTSCNASSSAYPMSATFIGSSGLFTLSSGYLVKDYIESTDRCEISVYGNATISPMTISGIPVIGSISTGDYIMPITSNITINLRSGTTSVSQNVELLPSVEINIDSGATFTVSSSKKVYVYDNDDWGNFTGTARLYVIGYSVANGTTTKRTAAGLVDAKINVNGNLVVAGNLYTSLGGANITSSQGTGTIQFNTAPGTGTVSIYEMSGNSDKTSVTFDPVRLHNGQNISSYEGAEYLATAGSAANTIFHYCINCDYWYTGSHECPTSSFTVTWMNYDGTVTLETDTDVASGTTPSYDGTTPTRAADAQYTYTFVGWSTSPNATSGITLPNVTASVTYYAAFSRTTNTYTITWKNYDGTVTLETDTNVAYGTTPSYDGTTPTKPATQQNTYTFVGWSTSPNATSGSSLPVVTGNATYYAAFSSQTSVYQVTFKNYDGTTLYTTTLGYGETPTYSGSTPTREATAQYTYSFQGWNDGTTTYTGALPSVTAAVTYTAVFTSTTNTYTITWKNEDGTTLETDTNVAYGATPTYNGTTPTKEGNAQYSYVFNGWTPAITSVTGDATYTATFVQTTNTYTVTWMNGETVLETDANVAYGATPSYDGQTPTRETTGRLHHVFLGWSANPDDTIGMSPEFFMVSGNSTYYAIFRSYAIGLYRDIDGITRLYDTSGNFRSDVSGIFFYDSSIYEVGDDRYYYLLDGVLQEGYGLVAIRPNNITYLYYVLEDGSILMESEGCTFYVAKANGYIVNNINVENGLYYFDSDGHMWFGNSLLTGNTEFGVISSANAAIGGGN